jgi:hypothetical protein
MSHPVVPYVNAFKMSTFYFYLLSQKFWRCGQFECIG